MSGFNIKYPSDLKFGCTLKTMPCARLCLKLPLKPTRALCTLGMRQQFAQIKMKTLRRKLKDQKCTEKTKVEADDMEKSTVKLIQSAELDSTVIVRSDQKCLGHGNEVIVDQNFELMEDKIVPHIEESQQIPVTESESDNTLEPTSLEGDGQQEPHYDALAEKLREEGYVSSSSSVSQTSNDSSNDESSDNEDKDLNVSNVELHNELVREVLYAFIGFDGKYLRLEPESNQFRMTRACHRRLERGQVYHVLRFANLGFYYKTLFLYTKTISTLIACGNCGRALAAALNEELRDYVDYVHILHGQYNEQAKHGLIRMTLLQLAHWHCDTEPMFKWLCLVLAECTTNVARGEHILCTLKRFACNGNPVLRELAKRLLCAASEPLCRITARWLTYGDVQDPYQDFFIMDTAAASNCMNDERAYFTTRYTLCLARLPPFLNRKMAEKIFAIGKCNKFEQLVMKECDRFTVSMTNAVRRLSLAAKRLLCHNDDNLLQDCFNYFCCVFGNVLRRCQQELNFMAHLRTLHKFVLLSDTNFVRFFIGSLASQLDDNNTSFYTCDINKCLQYAWHRSHEPCDDENMLEALDVEQCETLDSDMQTGWDTLTIVYRFDGPVSVLLTPSLPAYRTLFKPIWQLHRITFMLYDRIWAVQQQIRRHIKLPHKLVQALSLQMNGHIHKMWHVIGCLRFYHFTDVIQAAWLQLCARVEVAASIDELLTAHEAYLADVKHGFFQTNETLTIYASLKQIYACIFNFHDWQQRFLQAAKILHDTQELKLSFEAECELLRTEFDRIVDIFEKSLVFFLLALRRSADAKFMALFEALDYNQYYKRRDDRIQIVASFKYWRKLLA